MLLFLHCLFKCLQLDFKLCIGLQSKALGLLLCWRWPIYCQMKRVSRFGLWVVKLVVLALLLENPVGSVCCASVLYTEQVDGSRPADSSMPEDGIIELVTSEEGKEFYGLVPPTPLVLPYHKGPLLAADKPISLYVIYYGSFSDSQKEVITDFLSSISSPHISSQSTPSLRNWWALTQAYTDSHGASVSQTLLLEGQFSDALMTHGSNLRDSDLDTIVQTFRSITPLNRNAHSIFLLLTAEDVYVEGFCRSSCAKRFQALTSADGEIPQPYAWVGNSVGQCPGFCAWPYAKQHNFGPDMETLRAPNGDLGMDGMIINIAKMVVEIATNPYGTAYYQGSEPSAAMGAAEACSGIFGRGAYPGYPGELLVDSSTGASFNVHASKGRKFLVPWIWNPRSLACAGQV
eukprot:Gb_21019 [translate_table: standard]